MEAAGMLRQPAEPLKANITTCIPRLRTGGMRTRRPRRGGAPLPTSVTVIDRLRDALLRLAMLSAVTTSSTTKGAGRLRQTMAAASSVRMNPSSSATYPDDSYRSEAVDDCIEFFKRSAAGGATASQKVAR